MGEQCETFKENHALFLLNYQIVLVVFTKFIFANMDTSIFFNTSNQPHLERIFELYSFIEILGNLKLVQGILPVSKMENTYISSRAIIGDNVYIGNNCKIFDYANIRDNSIILDNCIIGHCSEVIRSFILPCTSLSHRNTIGGSLIGTNVNTGSNVCVMSTILSNSDFFNLNRTINLFIREGVSIDTKMTKFGCVVGDNCRIGSNACINPGSSIGKNSIIYPTISVPSGYYRADCLIKSNQKIVVEDRS